MSATSLFTMQHNDNVSTEELSDAVRNAFPDIQLSTWDGCVSFHLDGDALLTGDFAKLKQAIAPFPVTATTFSTCDSDTSQQALYEAWTPSTLYTTFFALTPDADTTALVAWLKNELDERYIVSAYSLCDNTVTVSAVIFGVTNYHVELEADRLFLSLEDYLTKQSLSGQFPDRSNAGTSMGAFTGDTADFINAVKSEVGVGAVPFVASWSA